MPGTADRQPTPTAPTTRAAREALVDGTVRHGIRILQFLVLWAFIAWALTTLWASAGWLTILVLTVLLIAVFIARPFLDGLVSSVGPPTLNDP
jgi:hypothetical protein